MAKLVKPSRKDIAEARYKNARIYLLMVTVISVINVIFFLMGVDRFYLVSTVIPYMAVLFRDMYAGTTLAWIALAVGLIYLSLMVLFWVLSRRNPGWLIAGSALYALDMIPVVMMYRVSGERVFLVSLVLHCVLLAIIAHGIISRYRLNNGSEALGEVPEDIPARGVGLRRADMEVKARILLQAEFDNHRILYRRVKKVNELVIDNYVYDEIELGIEPAHSLSARIDGKLYEVGYDGKTLSYFTVDGVRKAQKTRWY